MSAPMDPKRFAQELLTRGIVSTPDVAIERARRFERLWEWNARVHDGRKRAEDEILMSWMEAHNRAGGGAPSDDQMCACLERARTAGDKVERTITRWIEWEKTF